MNRSSIQKSAFRNRELFTFTLYYGYMYINYGQNPKHMHFPYKKAIITLKKLGYPPIEWKLRMIIQNDVFTKGVGKTKAQKREPLARFMSIGSLSLQYFSLICTQENNNYTSFQTDFRKLLNTIDTYKAKVSHEKK